MRKWVFMIWVSTFLASTLSFGTPQEFSTPSRSENSVEILFVDQSPDGSFLSYLQNPTRELFSEGLYRARVNPFNALRCADGFPHPGRPKSLGIPFELAFSGREARVQLDKTRSKKGCTYDLIGYHVFSMTPGIGNSRVMVFYGLLDERFDSEETRQPGVWTCRMALDHYGERMACQGDRSLKSNLPSIKREVYMENT